MKTMIKRLLFICLALGAAHYPAFGKPNVLFIAIDDMNDWIGPLGGHPQATVDAGRQPDVSFAYFGTPRLASLTSSIDLRMFFFQLPCNLSGLARSRVFRASSN